jgi:hypothetical protein
MKDKKNNLCDVLGQNARHVVFERNDRILVIDSPDDKLIRAKVKKGWNVAAWVSQEEDTNDLVKIVRELYNKKLKESA